MVPPVAFSGHRPTPGHHLASGPHSTDPPPPKSSHSAYRPSYIINTDGVKGCKNGFYPLDHFPYQPPGGLITVQSPSRSWVIAFGSAEQKVLSWCSSPPGEVFKVLRPGAFLVVQWLRICLPMQGTRVRALVWEDPTCRGATKPVSHNY